MSFAYHGNWCGPGWSAGQWKDAADLTEEDINVEAVDALDQACKNHDINIRLGNPDAHHIFYRETSDLGVSAAFARWMIEGFGPSTEAYLRGNENQPYEISTWFEPENRRRRRNVHARNENRERFMNAFDFGGNEADISQEYEEEKENDVWIDDDFITPDRMASQPTNISPNDQIISVENLPANSQVERPLNPDLSLQEWAEIMSNKRQRTGTSFYNLPPW